ncbi:MAG: hypothetical protein GF400_07240 [Candidatus Eisenbacteria bacterium]|nr:hypothetical protein [Candidatus Eisenbacteria bacterium]
MRFTFAALCVAMLMPALASGGAARPDGQAFQFGIQDLSLMSFDGTAIGYQRFVGRDVALRIGAGVDLNHSTEDYSELYITEADGEVLDESIEHNEWEHSAFVSCEWIRYRGRSVAFFFGGGPRLSYESRRGEDSDFYQDHSRHTRSTREVYGIGLKGALGVQWSPCDWLAVHAEYNAVGMYEHSRDVLQRVWTDDDSEFSESTTVERGFEFDSRGVNAGVSVYF